MSIPARLSIVTLGVSDLDRSETFYQSLGWERLSSSQPGEITWFQTADSYLGLFGFESLAEDANLPTTSSRDFGGITLAICLESEEAVSAAMDDAVAAGATLLKQPHRMEWGGFSGYFADPDGYPWELAFNPNFPLDEKGRITIP
jgi:catechol 2,3-dioxygenase-like lactoylglutathione lyase family enzyme